GLFERYELRRTDDRLAAVLNAATADAVRASSDAQLRAVALATTPAVQRMLAARNLLEIAAFDRRHQDAYATVPGLAGVALPPAETPAATTEVSAGGRRLGRITVLIRLRPVLGSAEASARGTTLVATTHGRIVTGNERGRPLALTPGRASGVSVAGRRYRAIATPLRAGDLGSAQL